MPRTIAGYTIPDTLNDRTPMQERASELKQRFEAEVRKIRAEASLSADGKRTLIARAWQDFKPGFEAFQRMERDSYAKAVRDQQMSLVGLRDHGDASAIVSFRDAMDRAEAIPKATGVGDVDQSREAAEQLLRRAQLSGDEMLARAVLCVAMDRGIDRVVDLYKSQHPEAAPDVDGYYALLQFDPDVSMEAYYLWQVKRPQEIASYDMGEDRIAAVAAQPVASLPADAPDAAPTQVPGWATSTSSQAQSRREMQDAPRWEV